MESPFSIQALQHTTTDLNVSERKGIQEPWASSRRRAKWRYGGKLVLEMKMSGEEMGFSENKPLALIMAQARVKV